MKKIVIWLIGILILLPTFAGLSGCNINTTDTPEIIVMANSVNIATVTGKNKWDGAIIDRLENFGYFLNDNSFNQLPVVDYNETITIQFKTISPQSFSLKEYILNYASGDMNAEEYSEIPLELTNKKGEFKLAHDATWEGYARGYKLVCTFGENECEYAFIIKTEILRNPATEEFSQDINYSNAKMKKSSCPMGYPVNHQLIIGSVAELQSYIDEQVSLYLDNNTTTEQNRNEYINQFKEQYLNSLEYDEAFFTENLLFIAHTEEGSGSISYNIEEIKYVGNTLTVYLKRTSPSASTDDMAYWVTIIEVSKADFNGSESDVVFIN